MPHQGGVLDYDEPICVLSCRRRTCIISKLLSHLFTLVCPKADKTWCGAHTVSLVLTVCLHTRYVAKYLFQYISIDCVPPHQVLLSPLESSRPFTSQFHFNNYCIRTGDISVEHFVVDIMTYLLGIILRFVILGWYEVVDSFATEKGYEHYCNLLGRHDG